MSFVGDKTRYAAVSSSDRELNWLFRECMEGPSGDQFIDDLSYLAVGDVLFRAIRNLTEFEDGADDLPDLPAKMQRVKVFLDTRLILRCLGIGRAELIQATNELTSMCRNTGCQLYCFEHTSDEVKGAIERAADRLRFGGDIGDDIHIWARSEGMRPSDLFEFAAKTAVEIEKLGFAVEAAPDIDEKTHFDEAALETRLEQAMLRQTDHARVADIRSISGIYHLRGSAPVMFLERCSAILITTNKPLADESQRYFRDHYREMGLRHRVQLCMTDNVFATRLWTKLPTKIKQTPRDQIIAHIYGNLEPSRKVLDGFTSFLGRVRDTGKISEEQFERVRLSRFARDIIAMETRNTTESPSTAENIAIYKKIVERDGELEAENRSLERDLSKEKERSKTLAEEIELLKAELEEAARQENSPTSDIEISEEDRIQAVDALRRIEEKQQAQARRITIRSGIVGLSRTTKVLVGIGLTGVIVALGVSTISPVAAFAHEKLVQVRLIDPASGMDLDVPSRMIT